MLGFAVLEPVSVVLVCVHGHWSRAIALYRQPFTGHLKLDFERVMRVG